MTDHKIGDTVCDIGTNLEGEALEMKIGGDYPMTFVDFGHGSMVWVRTMDLIATREGGDDVGEATDPSWPDVASAAQELK